MTRITGIMLVTLNPCVYLISGFYVGLSTYFLTITKLIQELSLESMAYTSKELKGLPDKDNPMNPMNPVNHAHAILKK
ncbi:MAG: hypothetical protein LBE65_02930, partial [Synergistaceae bacterium]|nr:hypothetical protein [Synergistaceae bacterium]